MGLRPGARTSSSHPPLPPRSRAGEKAKILTSRDPGDKAKGPSVTVRASRQRWAGRKASRPPAMSREPRTGGGLARRAPPHGGIPWPRAFPPEAHRPRERTRRLSHLECHVASGDPGRRPGAAVLWALRKVRCERVQLRPRPCRSPRSSRAQARRATRASEVAPKARVEFWRVLGVSGPPRELHRIEGERTCGGPEVRGAPLGRDLGSRRRLGERRNLD